MTQLEDNDMPSSKPLPFGYYGEAYRKLRDFVKHVVPNRQDPFGAAAILAIPDTQTVSTFSLDTKRPLPTLDAHALEQLDQATSAIVESGECGFVFLDLQSGKGIAYHAGEEPYIASASKAPLAYYVLQRGISQGNETPEWERQDIEAAIMQSDNDAFDAFGFNYMNTEYGDWLSTYDVKLNTEYGLYLYASARSMAAIWSDINDFLKTGSETAHWFADCLANTNRSFIRDGVADTGASTWNKGGWIAADGMSSTTDVGIIELERQTYLMAIVTGQPNSGEAQQRVADLARLLFAQRATLT